MLHSYKLWTSYNKEVTKVTGIEYPSAILVKSGQELRLLLKVAVYDIS